MAAIATARETRRWWTLTDPCLRPLERPPPLANTGSRWMKCSMSTEANVPPMARSHRSALAEYLTDLANFRTCARGAFQVARGSTGMPSWQRTERLPGVPSAGS